MKTTEQSESQQVASVSEIEFPHQLKEVQEKDIINTQKMLEKLIRDKFPVKLEDEIVISNTGRLVITACKNEQEYIFERSYEISDQDKLVNINSITLSKLNPKYYIYKRRLKN